jgi:hypothetical protein
MTNSPKTTEKKMMIRIRKILLPTDFSKYSAAATQYACELAMPRRRS